MSTDLSLMSEMLTERKEYMIKEIKGFKLYEADDFIEITDIKDFDLDNIFDCGQCFRWERQEDETYIGIAFGKIVRAEYESAPCCLRLYGASAADFENIWFDYFDLGRDYGAIKKKLTAEDRIMADAVEHGSGIRILNQEKWETLISFIISQNNNIPRIKKCIESLACVMGEKAGSYNGRDYYILPSPEVLADAGIEDLAPCRLGYRAKYLIETARKVAKEGLESLEALGDSSVSGEETLKKLREYCGVGPKVANCIALFSMGKFDSFPIDVWVKAVMSRLYGIDEKDVGAMSDYASENFGEYGGIAQQYLFYYITHFDI